MSGAEDLGVTLKLAPSFEKRKGSISDAPDILAVPAGGTTMLRAMRAGGLRLAVQICGDIEPFVSLSMHLDDTALYLPFSGNDLRHMAAALMRTADELDHGVGKQ